MGIRDDRFWAEFLGVDPVEWAGSGVSVRAHAGLRGYHGFWCFRRNRRVVLSAPDSWVPRLEEIVAGRSQDELMQQTFWSRVLGREFEGAVGPAFQGCLDRTDFVRASERSVKPMSEADAQALESFRDECGSEWNMPENADDWRHASFEGGAIVALAGYRAWSDAAGDPCVITRPDARNRGHGAAVVSAVVAEALENGKLLLYQTLESNEPAVRVALSLGFEQYASHLAIRLAGDAHGG